MSETLIAAQTDTAASDQPTVTDAGTVPVVADNQQSAAPAVDPAAAPAADSAASAEAEFTLPDGYDLGDMKDQFVAVAKEQKLSAEQTKAILELNKARDAAMQTRLDTAKTQWLESAKSDKEFGGDNLPANVAVARKALDTFGTPELRSLLDTSGLGNHPEIIRAFYRAGKAISEDRLVTGTPAAVPPPRTPDKVLFPTMN